HLLKLLQISSASRGASLVIDAEDFEIAQDWLLSAEKVMPDVFLEMAGRSDADVMRELWHYSWVEWETKQKGTHHARMMGFLSVRVPAWSAEKIIETATSAGYFSKKKIGNDIVYFPQPKNNWGQV